MSTAAIRTDTGDMLPSMVFVDVVRGASVRVPARTRDSLILLVLPEADHRWTDYVAALNRAADDVQHWYARILIVARGRPAAARKLRTAAPRLTVAADPAAACRRLGIAPATAAIFVVDRYGQLYHRGDAREMNDLPAVAELEEWVKFLATQCPECGVIDEPGHGEWSLT